MAKVDSAVGRFVGAAFEWASAAASGTLVTAATGAAVVGGVTISPVVAGGILMALAAYAGGRAVYSGSKQDKADAQLNDIRVWLEGMLKQYGSLVNALAGLPENANLPHGVKLDRIRAIAEVLHGDFDGIKERLSRHGEFETFAERSAGAMEAQNAEFRIALNGLIGIAIEQGKITKEQVELLNGIRADLAGIRTQQQRDSTKIDLIVDHYIAQIAQKDAEIGSLRRDLKSAIEAKAEAERKAGRSVDAMLEELRKGHPEQLLEFLDRQVEDDEANLIQRHRERAAVAFVTGDLGRATASLEKILALRQGDADVVNRLGLIARIRGELGKAEEAFLKLIQWGDEEAKAIGYGNLGTVLLTRGDVLQAEQMYRKSLGMHLRAGRQDGMATQYGNIGNALATRGEYRGAELMYRKSLEIDLAIGSQEGAANTYGNLGIIMTTKGELAEAEKALREAMAINERIKRTEGIANNCGSLGYLLLIRGEIDRAEVLIRRSMAINEEMGRPEGVAMQCGNLGILLMKRGDLSGAEAMHRRAMKIDERLGRMEGVANASGNLGNVLMSQGKLDAAEAMYLRSLDYNAKIGRLEGVAMQECNLGRLCASRGKFDRALAYWYRARDIYIQLGFLRMVRQIESWIYGLLVDSHSRPPE